MDNNTSRGPSPLLSVLDQLAINQEIEAANVALASNCYGSFLAFAYCQTAHEGAGGTISLDVQTLSEQN